jgi:hypothetical protein
MRSVWKHKWVVVIGAMVVFLSAGAVAWAATDNEETSWETLMNVTDDVGASLTNVADDQTGGAETPGAARRRAMQERRQERLERRAALMEHLRDDMSAEDQEKYDELVATIKEQRAALKEAREELAGTLKELRELTDKYLDVEGDASGD